MVSEEQLEKIREKHRRINKLNRKKVDVWRYIHSIQPLKTKLNHSISKMVWGIWKSQGLPRFGKVMTPSGNLSAIGVYDFNPKTDEYDHRSGVNFTNTNYTHHKFLEKFLKDKYGYILPYKRTDDGFDHESLVETVDQFCEYLYEHRFGIFDDSKIKDTLDEIKTQCVSAGNRSQKLISENHKLIWTESISYVDDDIMSGGSDQDFKGIDGVIKFEDKEETNQVKSSGGWEITPEGNYKIKVTTSLKQYEDIDYMSFTYREDIIVFKIDINLIEKVYGDNVYLVFDSSLLFFTNRLD